MKTALAVLAIVMFCPHSKAEELTGWDFIHYVQRENKEVANHDEERKRST